MERCATPGLFLVASFSLLCVIITWVNVKEVKAEEKLKQKYGYKTELLLNDQKNLTIILCLGFMSSFIGQIFGFGGAFIFNPAQIFLGVNPIVAASTSQFIHIFVNSMSVSIFVIFGKLNYQYTVWLGLFCGLGVFIGLFSIGWYMKKFNRPSIIAFALGLLMIVSILFSSTSNIAALIEMHSNGIDIMHGESIC